MDWNDLLPYIHMTLINFQHKSVPVDVVVTLLTEFERHLSNETIDDAFIEQHFNNLCAIKFELNFVIREPNVRSNNRVLLGFRDRIFGNLLSGIDVINERNRVTRIFNEFIKGITYFQGDVLYDVLSPVYHRSTSCPPNGHPNMNCNENHVNRIRVSRCYIERIIYDELWNHIMNSQQNEGHLKWLKQTKRAYTTCYPHTAIDSVSITYMDDIPLSLEIVKRMGARFVTETFTKSLLPDNITYIDLVRCGRDTGDTYHMWENTFVQRGTPHLVIQR